jgi:hypothetical protein
MQKTTGWIARVAAANAAALLCCAAYGQQGEGVTTSAAGAPQSAPPPLERRSYIHNLKVLAQHFPGDNREAKMQLMAIGERRYLIQANGVENARGQPEYYGQIVDISDPLKPSVVADRAWPDGFQIQVAYSEGAQKWIAMLSRAGALSGLLTAQGLRGIELYDISNPRAPKPLSRWSTDGGDPSRNLQTGIGPHRNYYDGGRYAYLSTAPDNSFFLDPASGKLSDVNTGLQIIDLQDPSKPKLVANWHFPGQTKNELEHRKSWKSAKDRPKHPFDGPLHVLHGGFYVPVRPEDGGKYAYGPWGSLGMLIHDVSDPTQPRLVSQWQPDPYVRGGLPFHTVDIARLDRGFVITNPEALMPQCKEEWHDSYILDVSDPAKPRQLSKLPVPQPPADAPYRSFCERYGRFGTHNPPHLKAPGKAAPNFTCYAYFNAGLQCYDITDPRSPKISAYFVPVQGGPHAKTDSTPSALARSIRTADNIFIEWDRKLLWVATDSGLYLLSAPALGEPVLKPMKVQEWALPSINRGHERFRPQP